MHHIAGKSVPCLLMIGQKQREIHCAGSTKSVVKMMQTSFCRSLPVMKRGFMGTTQKQTILSIYSRLGLPIPLHPSSQWNSPSSLRLKQKHTMFRTTSSQCCYNDQPYVTINSLIKSINDSQNLLAHIASD